ncbi:MAG: hypothetical protein JW936_07800 [Sedimentisphaerales bacterium]|nr:hypothetical protein [Sedimentisphaerales bacterium]
MAKRSKVESKVTLKIPRPLYEKISEMIDGRGYNSVTDFVVYVLRDLVASDQLARQSGQSQTYGKRQDQLEKVKARLRALGDLAADASLWQKDKEADQQS